MKTFKNDNLTIPSLIKREDGTVFDLTGATVNATFTSETDRSKSIVGTVTVVNASAGEILTTLAPGLMTEGLWIFNVRVSVGTKSKTVIDETFRAKFSGA